MSGTVGKTFFRDLTGHHYGMLTVLSLHSKVGNFRKWNCRCDCGKECVKYGHTMRNGHIRSCGCEKRRKAKETGKLRVVNLIGKRFGRLLVISRDGSNKHQKAIWLCKCDCGKTKTIKGNALQSGNTMSCGCIQKETMHQIRWNPDLSQEDRETNRNRGIAVPGIHLWRKEVYKRDRYRCVVCGGNKSGSLIAHHIASWAVNKDFRLDVENGATACVDCHKKFHSRYGWGENTLGQWSEFLTIRSQIGIAV